MSRRMVSSRSTAMLRIIGVAAVSIGSGGCTYFHPAFTTQDSRAAAAAHGSSSVVVCERRSLTRTACGRVSRDEINRILSDARARY